MRLFHPLIRRHHLGTHSDNRTGAADTRARMPASLAAVNLLVFVVGLIGLYLISEKAGIGNVTMSDGRLLLADTNASSSSGLKPGDTITAVAGMAIEQPDVLEVLLDGYRIGDTIDITVRRTTGPRSLRIMLDRDAGPRYIAIMASVGLLYFILGGLVAFRRPGDRDAIVFNLTLDCVAVLIMATSGCYSALGTGIGCAIRMIYGIAYALMPLLFIHFSLLFPRHKWPAARRALRPAYTAATVAAVAGGVLFIAGVGTRFEIDAVELSAAILNGSRWLFIAGTILSIASFIHSYRTTNDGTELKRLRLVVLGVIAGPSAFILCWLVLKLLDMSALLAEDIAILMSAATPVAFAIAIVRYRLMDINLLISRSSVYVGVVLASFILYGTIVIAARKLLKLSDTDDMAALAAMIAFVAVPTALIALAIAPIRRTLERLINRLFFREGYNLLQAQTNLGLAIGRCHGWRELGRAVVDELTQLFAPESIALFIIDGNGHIMTIASSEQAPAISPALVRDIAVHVSADPRPLAQPEFIEGNVDCSTGFAAALRAHGVALICAAHVDDRMALLALGGKTSRTRYTPEDVTFVGEARAIATQALSNIISQNALRRQRAETDRLRESDQKKSDYVSSASHELRTPLTSIRLFAELLEDARVTSPEKVREYARVIGAETERLERVIRNILDFSAIERGTRHYTMAPADLNDVTGGVLQAMQHQIAFNGFQLTRHLAGEPLPVVADRDALVLALTNLLSNAMKYSAGVRWVTVETFTHEAWSCVAVADCGNGIAEPDHDRIFEPFTRAANAGAVDGTGLGLALVRHTVDAHGGLIDIESTVGVGSRFTLRFPAAMPDTGLPVIAAVPS